MPEVGAADDSGAHTNPARWLHENHWDCNEVTIAAGANCATNAGLETAVVHYV